MKEDEAAELVKASYGRCCLSPSFFEDFYDAFIGASPRVAAKFAETDMERQKSVLRESISYLIMFHRGSQVAATKIAELAHTHSRSRFDIAPDLYALWERTLIETIQKHDERLDVELLEAWKAVLRTGIDALIAGYDA